MALSRKWVVNTVEPLFSAIRGFLGHGGLLGWQCSAGGAAPEPVLRRCLVNVHSFIDDFTVIKDLCTFNDSLKE